MVRRLKDPRDSDPTLAAFDAMRRERFHHANRYCRLPNAPNPHGDYACDGLMDRAVILFGLAIHQQMDGCDLCANSLPCAKATHLSRFIESQSDLNHWKLRTKKW